MLFLDVADPGPLERVAEGGMFTAILFVACVALIVVAIIVGVLLLIRRGRKKKAAANVLQSSAQTPADGTGEINKTE